MPEYGVRPLFQPASVGTAPREAIGHRFDKTFGVTRRTPNIARDATHSSYGIGLNAQGRYAREPHALESHSYCLE